MTPHNSFYFLRALMMVNTDRLSVNSFGLNQEDVECYESKFVRLNFEYCKKY